MFDLLGILVFLYLAGLEFIHSLNLFCILLVLNVLVPIQVVVEVDHLAEGDAIQDFHSLEGVVVKGETIESDGEDRWPGHELDSLFGVHLDSAQLAVVLVITL